jgi:hypothetical protein
MIGLAIYVKFNNYDNTNEYKLADSWPTVLWLEGKTIEQVLLNLIHSKFLLNAGLYEVSLSVLGSRTEGNIRYSK